MLKFFLILKIVICFLIATQSAEKKYNPCGQLYLTQSPNKEKYLEINWKFTCKNKPDTILLTFGDFKNENSAKIMYKIFPGSILQGYHKTNFTFKDIAFPGNWSENSENPDPRSRCFDFHVTSLRNSTVVYSQCLSIEPAWMSNFGNLRIGNMMIPGTHNSGAYRSNLPFIKNYILNQDTNFWQQLVYGIRFFDLRIGRYGKPPDGLYINHAFIRCTQLLPELKSAANFLRKSPREVIILNFHRFPYPRSFQEKHHLEILEMLETVFGNSIFPFWKISHRQGPKLREFWESGKRVIVSYRNEDLVKRINWLWPPIRREWGNIHSVQKLEDYIKSKTRLPPRGNPLNVLMAELTPNYLLTRTKTLKDLAVLVNRELSDWIRQDNRADNLNIIATDFFTGNDVIRVAIETNFRKLDKLVF